MTYDFYAEFWEEQRGVNFNKIENKTSEIAARSKLLKLSKNEEPAKNKYKEWLIKADLSKNKQFIESLKFSPDISNLKNLKNSVFCNIEFILKKPYLSQDDENFYLIDNPIVKDKIFKVPMVRPSSWKGALRHTAMRIVVESKDKIQARLAFLRLFGTEKDKIEEFLDEQFGDALTEEFKNKAKEIYKCKYVDLHLRGRLIFYPTFFNQIDLDVITPLDRKTKTPPKGPIQFEVAPQGETEGIFSLLYFPFDLIGKEDKSEIKEDLKVLKQAVPAMLTKYGFGAKTTSGYGVVKSEVKFQLFPGMEEEETDKQFGKKDSKFVQEMGSYIEKIGEEDD